MDKRIQFEDDPQRCQHVIPTQGQCQNVVVEGQKYCNSHGGHVRKHQESKENLRNYRLAKFNARAVEKTKSSGIKSLREEIAILRILIEEKINYCEDDYDLRMAAGPISDLVMKVEKLVSSCQRIEDQLGVMLDKTQALHMISLIIEIVSRHVENEGTLAAIAEEISAIDFSEIKT